MAQPYYLVLTTTQFDEPMETFIEPVPAQLLLIPLALSFKPTWLVNHALHFLLTSCV
jgi:hypothetical protein